MLAAPTRGLLAPNAARHGSACLSVLSSSHGRLLARAVRDQARSSSSVQRSLPEEVTPPLVTLKTLFANDGSALKEIQQDAGTSGVVRICGYVRSVQHHRNVTFVHVSDGSLQSAMRGAADTVQVVFTHKKSSGPLSRENEIFRKLSPGAAVEAIGDLRPARPASPQPFDFVAHDLWVTGEVDAATYPISFTARSQARKEMSDSILDVYSKPENAASTKPNQPDLRRLPHLRPRDAVHVTILKTRSAVERSIDAHLASKEFTRVAAPIITSSDCEGGGDVFRVSAEGDTSTHGFFSDSKAYLTVSAQLHLEALALGLGRVYTIGPSFRAEGSATNRHLAEFWMCEAEQLTSSDPKLALDEVMIVVEGVVRSAMRAALNDQNLARSIWDSPTEESRELEAVRRYLADPNLWPRITYTEAVKLLHAEAERGEDSSLGTRPPEWGASLASAHERWLARDGPVFVTHYPAASKPFYMRVDADDASALTTDESTKARATVACFDLLVPRIGELVGGSLRETRQHILQMRLAEKGLSTPNLAAQDSSTKKLAPRHRKRAQSGNDDVAPQTRDHLAWYTDDLRRYGCNPHGGFGLGMERLVAWLTRTENVRDVATFPRVKGRLLN